MAKFKVGDRVRINFSKNSAVHGKEATVVEISEWFEWDQLGPEDKIGAIAYYVNIDGVGEYIGGGKWYAFNEFELTPITDTWAQDKVSELIKTCMPTTVRL